MADPDPEDAHPGDRVTLIDPDGSGDEFEGVVSKRWSPGTINALYRPDGDGSFAEGDLPEYHIATSLVPAKEDGHPHSYRMGWDTE